MIKIVLWGHDFYGIGIDFDIDPTYALGKLRRTEKGNEVCYSKFSNNLKKGQ